MEIVIEISEEEYAWVKRASRQTTPLDRFCVKAIANGVPLPKGHGRLIDIGRIDEDMIEQDNPIICLTLNGEYTEAVSLDYLNSLPTIIAADKRVTANEDIN